jgi:hypothetical protein
MTSSYTPDEREKTLSLIGGSLQRDARVAGCVLVGITGLVLLLVGAIRAVEAPANPPGDQICPDILAARARRGG